MSAPTHIIDSKLPLTQDFKSLRKEGFAFIQENIGDEWTNMNASDPGVTILDQVCYALTELGYCNDFDIKDILTGRNRKLQLHDEFYLPQDILTTSPVSVRDYVKYLADGVEYVKNVVILRASDSAFSSCSVYQVYLLIDPAITDALTIKSVLKAAFFYLNKCRNIGELFLEPQQLIERRWLAEGKVEIEDQTELNSVKAAIDSAIRNYIFPDIIQTGYQQLVDSGLDTNEIFNGPLLQHGWISNKNLGKKRNQLNTIELTTVINAVPGVRSVSDLQFDSIDIKSPVQSKPEELIVIDAGPLNFTWPGSPTHAGSTQSFAAAKPRLAKGNIQLGAAVKVQTDVPVGKYRDINSYYSIQNTFPEIFAVGADATISNATNFQIAQSRQLKGYLTLFDQVLANQFSQLANINLLFSFKNGMTGVPSDEYEYYALKNAFEKEHPEYPVPYEIFSPTYFYQSLYDIPHIRPLLKGNDAFKFRNTVESEREFDHKSWEEFKRDPYNLYMLGLTEFMEEESDSLDRRNNILDHLLARHGESPVMIDTIIEGSVYTGSSLKDQVILKSLYLQNLGLLSYYRQKAYNYLGADKIPATIEDVPPKLDKHILYGTQRDVIFNPERVSNIEKRTGQDFINKSSVELRPNMLYDYQHDFIFDSDRVDKIEKLTEQDFINYSAVELKLSMLFALRSQYRDFIVHKGSPANKKLALWMITWRRGLIFIEMDLLLRDAVFEMFFSYQSPSDGVTVFEQVDRKLKYREMLVMVRVFQVNTGCELSEMLEKRIFDINGTEYTLTEAPQGKENKHYRPIPDTKFSFTVRTHFLNTANFENTSIFNNRVLAIFPSFIGQFKEIAFRQRLNFFFQNTLPLQITCGCSFVDGNELGKLIPAFTKWHNALIYHRETSQIAGGELKHSAAALASLINDINTDPND